MTERQTHTATWWEDERDGLHLTIRHTGLSLSLSSLSRPRGLLFPHFPTDVSLNDTVLIYCPSPHDKREKMLREGTEKILSRRGTRGEDGRKVKKMLLMLQSCLFAVVVVTLSPGGGLRPVDPLYIYRERVDQQHRTECSRLVVCDGNKLVWEVKR